MGTPRWEHDCSSCEFLGTWDDKDKFDLYVCGQGTVAENVATTVIARYGNEGSEYLSGFASMPHVYVLREAWSRAEALGWQLPAYMKEKP